VKTATFVQRVLKHPANQGRRSRQLAHAVRYQLHSRCGRPFTTPVGERSRIFATRAHAYSSLVVYSNPPDLAEVRAWRQLLRSGDLFIDVGANIGAYTILMAELGCSVIAIEPNAKAQAVLADNLALNGYEALLVGSVLADNAGSMNFTTGLGSMNRLAEVGDALVQATTLDDLLGDRTAAGVKIDVEGAERLVLEGGHRALEERRLRAIQLEWNGASETNFGESRELVLRLLNRFGYVTYRPSIEGHLIVDPQPAPGADVFALPGP
jgi:FkbM family methyltransferase